MTLDKFIENLSKHQKNGFGGCTVFYRHGASGDCGELGSAYISSETNECGPFDLAEDEQYVSIYAGN